MIKNGAHETSSNNDVKVDRMHSHNNFTVINIFVYNCYFIYGTCNVAVSTLVEHWTRILVYLAKVQEVRYGYEG